jgi:hypothetical protein
MACFTQIKKISQNYGGSVDGRFDPSYGRFKFIGDIMKFLTSIGIFAAAINLSACQPEPSIDKAPGAVVTKATPMRALSFKEITKLFSDKSFSPAREPLTGSRENDKWARSITYLRDDTNRAYRYYPNWTKTGMDYYALGPLVKGKQKTPITIDGKVFKNSDTFCLTDILSRNSSSCEMIFTENGKYYLNGKRNAEVLVSNGYSQLMGQLIPRAVKDDNNKLLFAMASDFGRLEPDLVAKFRKADNNIFIANAREDQRIRDENARIVAARKEKERKARAAEEAKRQARCKAKTGKACPASNGGILGAAIGGLISAAEGTSRPSSSSGSSSYQPKNKYTLICRERILFDVDDFKKGASFTCTGERYKCETEFENQLKSRYGSLSKACAAAFGSSYTYESIKSETAY